MYDSTKERDTMFATMIDIFGTAWAYYLAFFILGMWWLITKINKS